MTLRKSFIIPLMLLSFGVVLFAADTKKDDKEAVKHTNRDKKRFETALAKWTALGVKRYSMRVRYSAFSPVSGNWEVDIVNGVVTHWRFKNTVDLPRFKQFASNLTMDNFFTIAKGSLENETDRPFLIEVNYDSQNGHVRNVSRVKNP
ncbi:MAG TPA: DUF6174 domain-containing protein, partial [Spirochaetota bacterium]